MASKELGIVIKLKDAASRGIKSVNQNVGKLGATAKVASKGLKTLGIGLVAVTAAVAGMGVVLRKAITQFADFDDNMRAAGAVMNATAAEMENLTAVAQEMGKTTRFTSSQAAEALRFMGMAGLDATQSIEALPGVLQLAAAGSLDLGTAADITTNVLSAFGLEVENLGRVNDVLVKTFTSANVNLSEIGEAFKIVGPIAKGVGADFEDLVGTIGALGNAGIKGTLAGTALKGTLGALLNPTNQEAQLMKNLEGRLGGVALQIKDANGDFIGFQKILEQLEKAGLKGDEALKLFGERAGPGMAALLNMGSEGLAELIGKLKDAGGTSKEIADKMEAGLGGQIRRTISLWQSLQLTIGKAFGPKTIEFLTVFREALQGIIEEVNRLAENGEIAAFADVVIDSFKAINLVISKTYRVFRLFGALIANIGALATGDLGVITESVKGLNEEIDALLGRSTGPVLHPITDEMKKELEDAAKDDGPIGKGAKKVGKKVEEHIVPPVASIDAKLKAVLIRLQADLDNESTIIESKYKQGLIKLGTYYDQRAAIVTKKINAELDILKAARAGETDLDKQAILDAQIYAKQEQLNTALLKLDDEKRSAQDKLTKQRLKAEADVNKLRLQAEQAYQDQKDRIQGEGTTTLDTQFAKELADLQTKQNAELEVIRNYHEQLYQEKVNANASDVELERAKQAELAAVREQTNLQTEEKAKLIADQNLRLQEYKLNNLKTLAQGTSQIFTQLYELTGKKNKELFVLAKAAAIAEATMNVAQGVTKAIAQGGVFGIAQGALVAAAGAVQISQIASQGLAEGGEVQGFSPNDKADNIVANLTAKEFVHPVAAVKYYGVDFMESIRNRTFPRFAYADGGLVGGGSGFSGDVGSDSASGKGGSQGVTIINVTDPTQIDQYLSSSAGQDAVLNVLGARPEAAKRMLKGA